jgi:hypothetical protein
MIKPARSRIQSPQVNDLSSCPDEIPARIPSSQCWLHQSSQQMEERPSGAKAQRLCTFFGTAKAVPFQNGIDATSSSIHAPLSARLKRLRKNSPSARSIRKPSLGG